MSEHGAGGLERSAKNHVRFVVAAISEFSRQVNLTTQEGYRYLANHGGIDFLCEYYEAEHLLSFDDVIQDLELVTAQTSGAIE